MPFEISYRPLFTVKIEHDYLLDLGSKEFDSLPPEMQDRQSSRYQLSDYIEIQPSQETSLLLKRHRCRLHPNPDSLQVLTSTIQKNGKPAPERPLPDNAKLFFVARLKNDSFLSQANVPELLRHQGLFFSNRFEHSDTNRLQLTHPLPAFDPAASYQAGDLALDDANSPSQLFEAKTNLAPAPSPTSAHWLQLPAPPYQNGADYATGDRVLLDGKCYEAKSDGQHPAPPDNAWTERYAPRFADGVSAADRVAMRPPQFTLSLDPESDITFATATLKDTNDAIVWEKSFFNPNGEPLQSITIDASSLAPDFYKLDVKKGNGTSLPDFPATIYRLPDSLPHPPFALIEIQNRPVSSSHSLVDAQGNLTTPVFKIRFRKRHAYWRYLFHGNTADYPPQDTGPLTQEDPQDPTRFVTTEPLPLTTAPYTLGSFDDSAISLPAPHPSVIREPDRVVSQTFIHV